MSTQFLVSVAFFFVCSLAAAQVSQYTEQPITSAENWIVDDQTIHIKATVITGAALFTVHVIVDYMPSDNECDRTFSKKIAIYSIENGYLWNAIQYNKFSDGFDVRDDIVGVVLIYQTQSGMSGSRFAITKDDFPDGIKIEDFPLPVTFTTSERQSIALRIEQICKKRLFDQLYTLYSPEALETISDLDQAKIRTMETLSPAKAFDFSGEGFTTYIGKKGGIRGYTYYIPAIVMPNYDPDKKIKVFFKVTIIDTPGKYSIYGIDLNFPKVDDLSVFQGTSIK